jgi:phage-related protein
MQSVWQTFGDDIVTIMRTTWTVITGVVSTALDAILTAIRVNMRAARGVVETIMQLMRGDYREAMDTMLQTTRDILTTIGEFYERTFSGVLTFVRDWGPRFIGAIKSILILTDTST